MVLITISDYFFVGQIIITLLLLYIIYITTRSHKIAKMIIKDNTIAFAKIEDKDEFNKLMKDRDAKYKLVPINKNEDEPEVKPS